MDKQVEDYLSAVPAARKSKLDALHRLIMKLYPQAQVDLKYRMPTYQSGDGWVAIANQKHYVSLYTCGYHHIEGFKRSHPDIKTGKGCINFRDKDEIPLQELAEVIRHAIEQPKHGV